MTEDIIMFIIAIVVSVALFMLLEREDDNPVGGLQDWYGDRQNDDGSWNDGELGE